MDIKAFILRKCSPLERKQIDEAFKQGSEALKIIMLSGFNQGNSIFKLFKYKFH